MRLPFQERNKTYVYWVPVGFSPRDILKHKFKGKRNLMLVPSLEMADRTLEHYQFMHHRSGLITHQDWNVIAVPNFELAYATVEESIRFLRNARRFSRHVVLFIHVSPVKSIQDRMILLTHWIEQNTDAEIVYAQSGVVDPTPAGVMQNVTVDWSVPPGVDYKAYGAYLLALYDGGFSI